MNFGACLSSTPGRDGLVQISQLSDGRMGNVTDMVREGELVKIPEVDRQGRTRLSMTDVGERADRLPT